MAPTLATWEEFPTESGYWHNPTLRTPMIRAASNIAVRSVQASGPQSLLADSALAEFSPEDDGREIDMIGERYGDKGLYGFAEEAQF
ncbi:hypothetical protein VTL71DRAFT_9893 [Oculimacula yallundae]|uniref:Uncharacterized protein n=1 Tax=Oculimacula yallundae TaxID=86028 RepID=A0ABR4BQU8_9HELO